MSLLQTGLRSGVQQEDRQELRASPPFRILTDSSLYA